MNAPSLEKAATQALRNTLSALEASVTSPSQNNDKSASTTTLEADPSSICGHAVMVIGLEARPEINGQRGLAGKYDALKGRYAVQLDGGGAAMLLKRENIVVNDFATEADSDDVTDGAIQSKCAPSAMQSLPVDMTDAEREAIALAHAELAQVLLHHRRTGEAGTHVRKAKVGSLCTACFLVSGAYCSEPLAIENVLHRQCLA